MSDALTAGFHAATAQINDSRQRDIEGEGVPSARNDARLRSIVDRAVHLEEERKALAADLKDLFKEAQSAGYDPKAVKLVVKRQIESEEKRAKRVATEDEAELMLSALGMLADTPLGASAVDRAAH